MFFDAGETLVHPYPSFSGLFARVMDERGIPCDEDQVRATVERIAPTFMELLGESGVTTFSTSPEVSEKFWTTLYRRFLADLRIDDGNNDHTWALYAAFSDRSNYELFPDVLPVLQRLRKEQVSLGVISNFEAWLDDLLTDLGVGDLFDVKVISGIDGVEKPDPMIYQIALERAGVEADKAIHVGDHPVFDVETSASVGMTGVLLDRRYLHLDFPGNRITTLYHLLPFLELDP